MKGEGRTSGVWRSSLPLTTMRAVIWVRSYSSRTLSVILMKSLLKMRSLDVLQAYNALACIS